MATLLFYAYKIEFTDLKGPDWMFWAANCYDVAAKVPVGTSREQFRLMLQNLLADRFHLSAHHETKVMASYTIAVGKGGPKFRLHEASPDTPTPAGNAVTARPWSLTFDGTLFHMAGNNMYLKNFATLLTTVVQAPVVDETGLTGGYDFALSYTPLGSSPADSGPDIFAALQDQLGLKLTVKNIPRDIIMVDHVDKVPTEN
jgi:uncharacterized protein (TIGR03435 family)